MAFSFLLSHYPYAKAKPRQGIQCNTIMLFALLFSFSFSLLPPQCAYHCFFALCILSYWPYSRRWPVCGSVPIIGPQTIAVGVQSSEVVQLSSSLERLQHILPIGCFHRNVGPRQTSGQASSGKPIRRHKENWGGTGVAV